VAGIHFLICDYQARLKSYCMFNFASFYEVGKTEKEGVQIIFPKKCTRRNKLKPDNSQEFSTRNLENLLGLAQLPIGSNSLFDKHFH
jgi:hypothetical protein